MYLHPRSEPWLPLQPHSLLPDTMLLSREMTIHRRAAAIYYAEPM